jgi:hypothetical protein
VLEHALARLEHEVEAIEGAVALFEPIDDAQALKVVLEPAMRLHAFVQRILAGVAEWGMPEIVRERDGLREVVVEAQGPRDRPRDLRHLDAVRQPCAEQVPLVIDEDLGLVLKPAKGGRMDNAVTVPLKLAARLGSRLGEGATAAVGVTHRIGRQISHCCATRWPRRSRCAVRRHRSPPRPAP